MQDVPFDSAIDMIRKAINKLEDDTLAFDHVYLRIEDDEVCVKMCTWPDRDNTTQTDDDRLAAIRRFEREMYDDSNQAVWLEIFPCSIEVGYRDVTGREVTCSKEYQRVFRDKDDVRPESITECA